MSRIRSNEEHRGSAPTPFGLLGRLPQEIRDIIYEDVFSAGHISLAQTSKALHENSRSALSQYGVYRVRFCRNHWEYVIRPWWHPQCLAADEIWTLNLE